MIYFLKALKNWHIFYLNMYKELSPFFRNLQAIIFIYFASSRFNFKQDILKINSNFAACGQYYKPAPNRIGYLKMLDLFKKDGLLIVDKIILTKAL